MNTTTSAAPRRTRTTRSVVQALAVGAAAAAVSAVLAATVTGIPVPPDVAGIPLAVLLPGGSMLASMAVTR